MDVDAFMAFLEPRPNSERGDLIDGIAVLMDPVTLVHGVSHATSPSFSTRPSPDGLLICLPRQCLRA